MNLKSFKGTGNMQKKARPSQTLQERQWQNAYEWQIPFKLKEDKNIYKQQNQNKDLELW